MFGVCLVCCLCGWVCLGLCLLYVLQMFSIHLLLMGACFGCVSHCFLYDLCVPLCLWCDEFVILRYVGCVVACWFVCLWFAWLCVGHVCGDACGIVGLCLVCFLILSVLCFVNVCACVCMFVVCVVFGSCLCICCLCLVHVRCVFGWCGRLCLWHVL